MNSINIPRTVVNRILAQSQHDEEQEICGLIGINSDNNMQVYPVTNIAGSPTKHFEMEHAELIATMKQIREQNQQLFAIYHSHPHAPAVPSQADIEDAGYPEALYLIVSLNTKGVLEMRGFKLHKGNVQTVDLLI